MYTSIQVHVWVLMAGHELIVQKQKGTSFWDIAIKGEPVKTESESVKVFV